MKCITFGKLILAWIVLMVIGMVVGISQITSAISSVLTLWFFIGLFMECDDKPLY